MNNRNHIDSEKMVNFFSALSNKKRMDIVLVLMNGEKCVSKINEQLNFAQPNLSQHLLVLRNAGILECCKCGNQRCYTVKNPKSMREILAHIAGMQ